MALMRKVSTMAAALGLITVAACSHESNGPADYGRKSWIPFVHSGQSNAAIRNSAALGVNSYLWRATLDTLAFMPLVSADPYGGVIITDWYANPEKPDERFKATVYILDTRLRADGLNVTIFKQVKDTSGAWADAVVSDDSQNQIENAILTKARQLRLSNIR